MGEGGNSIAEGIVRMRRRRRQNHRHETPVARRRTGGKGEGRTSKMRSQGVVSPARPFKRVLGVGIFSRLWLPMQRRLVRVLMLLATRLAVL